METISVIGLGYVGLPLAIAFSGVDSFQVVAYDINIEKVTAYNRGEDPTGEVGDDEIKRVLKKGKICFSSDEAILEKSHFHIVAVPTPLDKDKRPDLTALKQASQIVGRHLKSKSIVVYESTVYPGCTEEYCLPILEKESGLKRGRDFKIGYSPERINPGDREHCLTNIVKLVSAEDDNTLERIASIYEQIIKAGVRKVSSIQVAEAAKVIENTQRDINIAFVNELSKMFHKMGIDTKEVLDAAGTKWNFLPFKPGLVGGHCIGVDPYYLAQRAQELGYHPEIILAGRRLNDGMGEYVAREVIHLMVCKEVILKRGRVLILGFTFKENCNDSRNTQVIQIIKELERFCLRVDICDPLAKKEEVQRVYGPLSLIEINNLPEKSYDALILAVPHRIFENLDLRTFLRSNGVLYDVKGVLPYPVDGSL